MRVFLGISEIAGNCSRLKAGLIELGHFVTFFAPTANPFEYTGIDPTPKALANLLIEERDREAHRLELTVSAKEPFPKRLRKLLIQKLWLMSNILKFCLFASGYDAFVFMYGNTFHFKSKFLHFNDLFWLRLLGKTVVFRCSGSDARPGYLDGAQFYGLQDQSHRNVADTTRAIADNNRVIDKYASYVVGNRFTSHFFRRPLIPLQLIGHAIHLDAPPSIPEFSSKTVILHAPSRSDAKGTSEITRMIEELKAEGLDIDFRIVTGKANAEVISEITRCDFVVDQMYSDLALGTFPAEAAYLGKPAVVGGYLTEQDLREAYDHWGVPPSEYCHPSKMKETIRRLIEDVHYRRRLGEQAKAYITNYWSAVNVAKRYLRLFRRDVPSDWFWDPRDQNVVVPVCMSEKTAAGLISGIVSSFGEAALCLDDKPALKRSVLELASRNEV